jgi:hypothetical protein
MRDALYISSLSSHALARHAFVKHVCGNQVKAAIYSLVLLDHRVRNVHGVFLCVLLPLLTRRFSLSLSA